MMLAMWLLGPCIGCYIVAFSLWWDRRKGANAYEVSPTESINLPPQWSVRFDAAFDAKTGEPLEPAWAFVFDAEGHYMKRVLCIVRKKQEEQNKWQRLLNQWWKNRVRKSGR